MSNLALNHNAAAERAASPTGLLPLLPWMFAGLGVLAPLALVIVAALGSDSSLVRAQMIVQGGELLAIALMFTALLGLLYALGVREAALVTAAAPRRVSALAAGGSSF